MAIRYSQIARENVPAMPIALLFYVGSIVIIAAITYHQGAAIRGLADMSLLDLFRFQ
jgi:hypothetical protein